MSCEFGNPQAVRAVTLDGANRGQTYDLGSAVRICRGMCDGDTAQKAAKGEALVWFLLHSITFETPPHNCPWARPELPRFDLRWAATSLGGG